MGLIKTGLKAVVAVKTADVIHERILERQAAQSGGQGPPQPLPSGAPAAAAPPPAPAAPGDDILDRLTRLGELRANGVLTEAEFEAQKARILNG
jgi:hypothetical protein